MTETIIAACGNDCAACPRYIAHPYEKTDEELHHTAELWMDNSLKQQASIYIGLNDLETGVQKYDTEKYLSILKNTCRSYRVAFSVQLINGGYFHEDGRYVEEKTLMLRLVDVPDDTVIEIAKDLCVFFNQESVMVTLNSTSVVFVKERL